MLKPAIYYQDELNKCRNRTFYDPKFKYYYENNWYDYDIKLDDNTYYNIQDVSIDKNNNVIGYISSSINHVTNSVTNWGFINFTGKPSMVFGKDLYNSLYKNFITLNFNKLIFSVVIGNPAEKQYDRFIKKCNGRIVGIFKDECILIDGKLYDTKVYEIMRNDFIKSVRIKNDI